MAAASWHTENSGMTTSKPSSVWPGHRQGGHLLRHPCGPRETTPPRGPSTRGRQSTCPCRRQGGPIGLTSREGGKETVAIGHFRLEGPGEGNVENDDNETECPKQECGGTLSFSAYLCNVIQVGRTRALESSSTVASLDSWRVRLLVHSRTTSRLLSTKGDAEPGRQKPEREETPVADADLV